MAKNPPKIDLSKFLTESEALVLGVDPALAGADRTARVLVRPSELGMPYTGTSKACARHRGSMRELDIRPKRVADNVVATAHTCLDCGATVWRLHPGPVRRRRERDESPGAD